MQGLKKLDARYKELARKAREEAFEKTKAEQKGKLEELGIYPKGSGQPGVGRKGANGSQQANAGAKKRKATAEKLAQPKPSGKRKKGAEGIAA